MNNSKYICLIFALLALKSYCDPQWVNQSFSLVPNIFITTEILPIPPLTTVVKLMTGPEISTNLFALGTKIGDHETNDISILNSTTLSSVREFFDIGSLYPLETVAIVSLPGYIFYTAVVKDRNGNSQIYGFPMLPGSYFPEEVAITQSTDNSTQFKVLQLLAHGSNPLAIYTETRQNNESLYIALINSDKKKVEKLIFIASGNVSALTCDAAFNSTSILCLYKIDKTIYRVYVSLVDENAVPTIQTHATDARTIYVPQMVVASIGYYVCFTASIKGTASALLAQVFNGSSDVGKPSDISTVQQLKSFNGKTDKFPLQGAIPYGDGFAAFYRSLDASGNQSWFYSIYNKDLSVSGAEVKLADVTGSDSEFKVAKEVGVGAVNIAAFTYTTWHGALVLNVYYGQILSESSF